MTPRNCRDRLLIIAALVAMSTTSTVAGAGARSAGAPLLLAQSSPAVSPDAAAERVRALTGGRILDVRLDGSVYRVKVLLDGGRVRIYQVDAASGRVVQ